MADQKVIAVSETAEEEAASMLKLLSGELGGFASAHTERGFGEQAIQVVPPEVHGEERDTLVGDWGGANA